MVPAVVVSEETGRSVNGFFLISFSSGFSVSSDDPDKLFVTSKGGGDVSAVVSVQGARLEEGVGVVVVFMRLFVVSFTFISFSTSIVVGRGVMLDSDITEASVLSKGFKSISLSVSLLSPEDKPLEG